MCAGCGFFLAEGILNLFAVARRASARAARFRLALPAALAAAALASSGPPPLDAQGVRLLWDGRPVARPCNRSVADGFVTLDFDRPVDVNGFRYPYGAAGAGGAGGPGLLEAWDEPRGAWAPVPSGPWPARQATEAAGAEGWDLRPPQQWVVLGCFATSWFVDRQIGRQIGRQAGRQTDRSID